MANTVTVPEDPKGQRNYFGYKIIYSLYIFLCTV